MAKAESREQERRAATRYRVPGQARLFWPGGGPSSVAVYDMSAHGCQVVGRGLPDVGMRMFLSLDIGGLPNVRLPATIVRRSELALEVVAGVRFDVPPASTLGLSALLAQHECGESEPIVLVVDSDTRSRDRIVHAIRGAGARAVAVSSTQEAIASARSLEVRVVLARADQQGLEAIAAVARERPQTFRVAFGRSASLDTAIDQGFVQATADDPCSAKCLSDLLRVSESARD